MNATYAARLAKSAYEKLHSNDKSELDELRRLRDSGDSEAGEFLFLLEGTRSGVNKRPELSRMLAERFFAYKDIRSQPPKETHSEMIQTAFNRMT